MGLFDIFSFKKDSVKVLSKEFFTGVLSTTREAIIDMAKENIPGIEKKRHVDAIVTIYVQSKTRDVKNKIVLWLIEKLIEIIPEITQIVYDFLKEKIENL